MMGFDCLDNDADLTHAQRKEFNKLKIAIKRNLQVIEAKPSYTGTYDSYKVLCAAFRFQDETTPKEVRDEINKAIITMTQKEERWNDILKDIGGEELCRAAKRIRNNKRGLHKRGDEEQNDLKLIGLLVRLLQEHGKANYRGNITAIHRDLLKLCKDKKISTDGVKKSTFFNKIRDANFIVDSDTSS